MSVQSPRASRARYVMIGGFLGAGKSTAVGRLARHLTDSGLRVGLITNDQGSGLVDTRNLRHQGFPVEEIAGGCFCCRFDALETAARSLAEDERPDVFVAEPVGSCTDLVATVSYPLRRLYGERFEIAPLSVMVDPLRAARVLGLEGGRRFSSKVTYVYEKQLEEAHALVINKTDLLDELRLRALRRELERRYPGRPVFEVSAREQKGLDAWFDHLETAALPTGPAMEIDYELYGEGEALLGWLNATLRFDVSGLDVPAPDASGLGATELDGNEWTENLARELQAELAGDDVEVAHLKMTLSPAGEGALSGDLALVSLVSQEVVPELSERLSAPVGAGQLVVNLRAEAPPSTLRRAFDALVSRRGEIAVEHVECFEPGQPRPTHRMLGGS